MCLPARSGLVVFFCIHHSIPVTRLFVAQHWQRSCSAAVLHTIHTPPRKMNGSIPKNKRLTSLFYDRIHLQPHRIAFHRMHHRPHTPGSEAAQWKKPQALTCLPTSACSAASLIKKQRRNYSPIKPTTAVPPRATGSTSVRSFRARLCMRPLLRFTLSFRRLFPKRADAYRENRLQLGNRHSA